MKSYPSSDSAASIARAGSPGQTEPGLSALVMAALGVVFGDISTSPRRHGHVGAKPIRVAWFGLVLPALVLDYAGQAGLLLDGSPVELFAAAVLVVMTFAIIATATGLLPSRAKAQGHPRSSRSSEKPRPSRVPEVRRLETISVQREIEIRG
jgi:K+ transporter